MTYSISDVREFPHAEAILARYNNSLKEVSDFQEHFLAELILSLDDLDNAEPAWFSRFDTQLIVEFLKLSHQYFLERLLPSIERLVEVLSDRNESEPSLKEPELLIFRRFKEDLISHMNYEETFLFPFAVVQGLQKQTNERRFDEVKFKELHPEMVIGIDHLIQTFHKKKRVFENSLAYSILMDKLHGLEIELKLHEFIEEEILLGRL